MRITKTREQAAEKLRRREQANKGCNICPCCGENKPTTSYGFFENKGILSGLQIHDITIFGRNTVRDVYPCKTCGAEWESDPYPNE